MKSNFFKTTSFAMFSVLIGFSSCEKDNDEEIKKQIAQILEQNETLKNQIAEHDKAIINLGGELSRCPPTGTIDGHDYYDLGTSVLWATDYLGVTVDNPEPTYYEFFLNHLDIDTIYPTDEKEKIIYGNYYINITLKPEFDPVRKEWGGGWRLPTLEEVSELYEKCFRVDCIREHYYFKPVLENDKGKSLDWAEFNYLKKNKIYDTHSVEHILLIYDMCETGKYYGIPNVRWENGELHNSSPVFSGRIYPVHDKK